MAIVASDAGFSVHDFQVFREFLRDLVILSRMVQAIGRSIILPGSNIVAIEEVIVRSMHFATLNEVLE
ncbi:hypothetical protein M413DRAFT_30615 [Hebeloma cylindrosporum]|uniref:Uncharacterized protein n=1 Tax=Hebeloma cylindrosporum TaxID=76867 RepID=A0A0C2XJJ4_HEBCY|nr:hypothetical protein M413DRAFT_30615 [Hebeloma cylindrosporum h7]